MEWGQSRFDLVGDPEQRIYEFIGADPERLNHYREAFKPLEFDLGDDNHRSGDTDIARFGNDVLKAKFQRKAYDGISLVAFPANQNQAYAALKGPVFQARKRLIDSGKNDWSLAVLVPTKRMTRNVSDHLRSQQDSMPAIQHSAFIDVEAALLAAEIIAFLLQPKASKGDFRAFAQLVCNFYEGRGGDTPSKTHIAESARISAALDKARQALAEGKHVQ